MTTYDMLLLSVLTGNLHCHTKTQQNSDIKLKLLKSFKVGESYLAERHIIVANLIYQLHFMLINWSVKASITTDR